VGVPENVNSLLRRVVHAVICYSQHNAVQRDYSLSGDCIFCMACRRMLYGCKDPKFFSSKYFFDVIKTFLVTLYIYIYIYIYIQFRVFIVPKSLQMMMSLM
jgi:hypothetical protein